MLSRLSLAICALFVLAGTAVASPAPSLAVLAHAFPVPPIRARAAVVMDANSGAVLGAKNAHLHLAIASTTKMMTALLALKLGHLSDRVTVPASFADFESDATVMGLHAGQVVTLKDLLYGLLLPSGADAATTIAIHYAGSESRFVTLMNQEAAKLGMHDTHYATPHGLTAPNQYSSAYDQALLGRYVSSIPTFMKIVSTRSYRWNGHTLTNLNKVMFWYPNVDGIKPGYTYEAGICQVLDARRDGRHVVVVILNTPDLVIDARNLLNFGLRDFTWAASSPNDNPGLRFPGTDAGGQYIYYVGSGHYVRGAILKAYAADGGSAVLGFPRTEALTEGRNRIQYFQNGALSLNRLTGRVTRLALGLTPVPAFLPTPTPTPAAPLPTSTPTRTAPTPTLTPTPAHPNRKRTIPAHPPTPTPTIPEATIVLPNPHVLAREPRAGATATLPWLVPTPTPAPKPPAPTPTPAHTAPAVTAQVFARFQRAHSAMLGSPVASAINTRGYAIQIFAYGALAYNQQSHALYLLPIGDRLLAARGYLPAHPGNVYPPGFAPSRLLRTIGWPPYN